MRTGATHLRPGVTLSAKFASSPPEMQSEQATLFRGWRVSALAVLKAVGNHLREATHAHHTGARARAHTKPSSSSCPDSWCLKSRIRGREDARRGEPSGEPPLSPGHRSCYSRHFPALAVTPAFPPWVPGSNSAQYRALSRFKFPSPTPLLPKSTDQLSPASPIPCLHSPKQRHFLPGLKTFSSLGNAIRQETRSAATSTRFSQRPGGEHRLLPGRCAPGDRPTPAARASSTHGGRRVPCPLVASCSALRERVS